MLVSLLTLDVKSFGAESLRRTQVVKIVHSNTTSTSTLAKHSSTSSSLAASLRSSAPAMTPNRHKVGVSGVKPGKSSPANGQTIRIGNIVIPVMTSTSLLGQGQGLFSPLSSAQEKNSFLTSLAQGQIPVVSSSLAQGHPSSTTSSPLKMSPLTIQQLQSLLSRANIPKATPPGTLTRGPLSGGSSISINRSATGGSGVTIRKVEMVAGGGESNTKDKPLSNLLRSYLAKNASTSTSSIPFLPSIPQAVSLSSSAGVLTSHSSLSTRSTPSPTSSLSSSSSLSSVTPLSESFATQW